MATQTDSIYQSGQKVTAHGWYEAVGVSSGSRADRRNKAVRAKIYELQQGELFPNFDGRAICWHLIGTEAPRPELQPSRQDYSTPPMS